MCNELKNRTQTFVISFVFFQLENKNKKHAKARINKLKVIDDCNGLNDGTLKYAKLIGLS